ncbi:MAG: ribonuclease III [Alphaproteobacteria bacterium]|nr:MAG: ribonuclease III [Alphaproteobacteria bacterium]
MDDILRPLEQKLDYQFRDRSLLEKALRTPGSIVKKLQSYERLEFLGDRVLGLIVAEMLYHRFPEERQGDLSKRFVALVRQETLVEIAKQIELLDFTSSVADVPAKDITPSMLSDVMEALIAAIYVDAGFVKSVEIIGRLWQPMIDRHAAPPRDAKTELQEWAQARGLGLPKYDVTQTKGRAHQPTFTVQVSLAQYPVKSGTGKNKRIAEQEAAGQLLEYLEKKDG